MLVCLGTPPLRPGSLEPLRRPPLRSGLDARRRGGPTADGTMPLSPYVARNIWRPRLRAELCCPRPNVRGRCMGIGAYQRNTISARLTALEPHAARLVRHRPRLAIQRPNAIEHASLEFRADLDVHVRPSRATHGRTAARRSRMSNQPKICCADDSTIGNTAFPTGRDQHASSQMRLRAQRGTQHSSARNIGRHSARAGAQPRTTACH